MKVPDVNIWLALALSGHSHPLAARTWLDGQETPNSIFFCRRPHPENCWQGIAVLLPCGVRTGLAPGWQGEFRTYPQAFDKLNTPQAR